MMEPKVSYNFVYEGKEHNYIFVVPAGAPLGEAYDACHKALQGILELAEEASKKMEPQKGSEATSNASNEECNEQEKCN